MLAVVFCLASLGCGNVAPTEPALRCASPAPLLAPSTCANPNAAVDEFIVRLKDGTDLRAEATRLGQKYGFTPEFFGSLPNYFGAHLTRAAFVEMQCESTVAQFQCSNTNIPPP